MSKWSALDPVDRAISQTEHRISLCKARFIDQDVPTSFVELEKMKKLIHRSTKLQSFRKEEISRILKGK